jgi:AcrR family transcriptional regulator
MKPTQAKTLGISAELFAERGFSAVSMRDIARSAGITQAAIYHHFANKEDLYIAALEHLYAAQTTELVSMAGQAVKPCQFPLPEIGSGKTHTQAMPKQSTAIV